MTGAQAAARTVSPAQASNMYSQCVLSEGKDVPTKKEDPKSPFTLGCCAVNSKGIKWCVTCYGGTVDHPTDCDVVTSARARLIENKIPTRPGGSQLAPTKKKKRFPPIMGKYGKPPAANAPNKYKTKSRPYLNKGRMSTTRSKSMYYVTRRGNRCRSKSGYALKYASVNRRGGQQVVRCGYCRNGFVRLRRIRKNNRITRRCYKSN